MPCSLFRASTYVTGTQGWVTLLLRSGVTLLQYLFTMTVLPHYTLVPAFLCGCLGLLIESLLLRGLSS